MALQASINAKLKLGDDTYDVSLDIPSAAPTKDSPYKFAIAQETSGTPVDLLNAVIGDETHFYVAVMPPQAVLSLTGGVVEALDVIVNEGGYDPATGKFAS